MVEVKFLEKIVDIEVVRNAVGVLQDVREYWTAYRHENEVVRPRYQYVYAIFSSSGYKRYAYAHDIYLIPLARSAFLQPIIAAIKDIQRFALPLNAPERHLWKKELLTPYDPSARGLMHPELRRYIRATIKNELGYELSALVSDTALHLLSQFCHTCRQIDGAVLGMIARQFPVFLVPGPDIALEDLRDCPVEIYWDNNSWYLQLQGGGRFSFDLPAELFNQYAEHGILSEQRALDLKAGYLFEIQAVIRTGGHVRVVTFRLGGFWLERMRRGLEQANRERE